MTDRLPAAFSAQAVACRAHGSPFMGQLCDLLAARLTRGTPLTDRLFDWPGELGPAAHSVPLRLCGALHWLRLTGNTALDQCYPPAEVDDDTLWRGVAQALTDEAEAIDRFIDNAPQTNEVRRSACLIAAAHWLTARHGLPLRCSELGASAGINLNWHRFALQTPDGLLGPADPALVLRPDWTGGIPDGPAPEVIESTGVDISPVTDPLRLKSYLWPDQKERVTLTEAALRAGPRDVVASDAVDWLLPRLPHIPGRTHLVYSTVAWQYFPAERQATGTAAIEAVGATATPAHPLAWLTMETDHGSPGASMTIRLWPGDIEIELGRIDFHGRWLRWDAV